MDQRSDAAPAAALFDADWSAVRGRGPRRASGTLTRSAQMARAARGHSPAVFKAIRNGGCRSRTQLSRQLAYLTTKSSHVFDARGAFDGQRGLTPAQIEATVARFADQWDIGRNPKLGYTSHLLMSFPIGTTPAAVRAVSRGVCDQFFQGEGAQFDYVVAVHEDRANVHAHIVLNRQSPDGEMFFLRSGHRFSYEGFRGAMVMHGDRHGLRLEASHRLDRGVLAYKARDGEIQRARVLRHAPAERQRVGPAHDRAIQQVALAASTYRGLAAEASREGFEDVSAALLRASDVLARNGILAPARKIDMTDELQSFDGLIEAFSQQVRLVEERIATARPAERPQLERQLNEVLATVAHLNPLGPASATLHEPARPEGLYAGDTGPRGDAARLAAPRVQAALDAVLAGTGLDAAEVAARLGIGAPNAALERQWIGQDLRQVAAKAGLDLGREADLRRALDRADTVHADLDRALTGVLGPRYAAMAPEAAEGDVPALYEAQEGRGGLTRPEAARLIEATAARLREAPVERSAFADPEAAQAFRMAVDRTLDGPARTRLAQGDTAAAGDLAADPLDRLHLARAYLEAAGSAADPAAEARLVAAIGDARAGGQRLRPGHAQAGPRHV